MVRTTLRNAVASSCATPARPLVALLAALALAACGDDGNNLGNTPGTDTGDDTAIDAGDAAVDVAAPDADAAEPDATVDVVEDVPPDIVTDATGSGTPCETTADCPDAEFCIEGTCDIIPCAGAAQWWACETAINEIDPGTGEYAQCADGLCRVGCILDEQCGEGAQCTDFGRCVPFDGDLTQPQAGGDTLTALQAGFGESMWNYPVGLPLGGYGERIAFDDGRYALSLRASRGQLHAMTIRTVVLDNGEHPMVIVRIPAIFTGMALHEQVARYLQSEYGGDWRSQLVISSTHTHSGPCRHWHLPEQSATPLGGFGIGEFNQWAFDWLLESTIESVADAFDDMAPARIGWEILEAYDMDDQVGRDRWSATPPFDDNRALLIRVDDMDGVPRGVLFSFAAHGTDNESDYASGDALGGVEAWLEMRLGEEYGRFVPTMFINQNSGSMSPAGSAQGHRFPQTMDRIGWAFQQRAWDELMAIETSTEFEAASAVHRFPITYDLVGYEPGEFGGPGPRPVGGEYHFGGISCVAQRNSNDRDYATYQLTEDLACAGALQFLLFNQSPTTMNKSQVLVARFGQGDDTLNIITAPGELAQELSWQMIRELRDDYDIEPLDTWTFGYVNDHLLYLLPTNLRGERPPFPGMSTPHPDDTSRDANGFPNTPGAPDDYPDFAFSYLQGGYESTMSPWGPRFGDYFVEQTAIAWGMLDNPPAELEPTYPTSYTHLDTPPFEIDESDPSEIGDIVIALPETIERMQAVEFGWVGGDPGAEMPQTPVVTLERDVDGTFEAVTLPNTRAYTNLQPRFMTRLRGGSGHYEWIVRWEELHNFPAGTYRMRVDGHYRGPDGVTPYQVLSPAFEFAPSDDVIVDASLDGTTVNFTLGYPAAQRMNFLETPGDYGAVDGNFRMRHPMVPTDVSAPLEVDIDVTSANIELLVYDGDSVIPIDEVPEIALVTAPEVVDGRGGVPVTRGSIDLSGLGSFDRVVIQVTDVWGNTGEADLAL